MDLKADLKTLWHSSKEFPSNNVEEWENKRILYKTEDGHFTCVNVGDYEGWVKFVRWHAVEEWAYVEDLYYK